MGRIKVAIVDDNESIVSQLNLILSGDPDIRVVGTSFGGMDALTMIKEKKPDLVLLDLIMPMLDGLGVMEQIRNDKSFNKVPSFIIISETGEEGVIANAFELGASYFIMKPFDDNMLLARIKQVIGSYKYKKIIHKTQASSSKKKVEMTENNLEWEVTDIIHKIGVPPHIRGYQYLRDAIIMSVGDERFLQSVTKLLYPFIAQIYDITSTRVERAIRNAILVAWDRGKTDMNYELFGYHKPTNSEFMAVITDRIRLEIKLRA